MVNDIMLTGFMEKKQYIAPLIEVTLLASDVVMQAFGPASMPDDQFGGGSVAPSVPGVIID